MAGDRSPVQNRNVLITPSFPRITFQASTRKR